MAVTGDPAVIRRFVLDSLRLSGAPFSLPDEELIIATCRVTKPGVLFGGPRVVEEQLQLVFTPEGAGRHPTAELVCAGSYRLQWFIAEASKKGFLAKGFYADDLGARRIEREVLSLLPGTTPRLSFRGQRRSFVPHLLAVFKLTAMAHERREELLVLALNLVDGSFRDNLAEKIRRAPIVPELQYQRVERRRLTWRETWRRLQDRALARVSSYGGEWYRPALERLAAEGGQLRRYYQEMLAGAEEPGAVEAEYAQRLREIAEKYSPVVRIELTNAALLYLPLIVLAVAGHDGRPLPPIKYEPAAGKVYWDVPG